MAAGVEPGSDPKRRLSWPVLLLILTAVTSSSLFTLLLYQLVVLRADVEELKSEVCRRRQEGQEGGHIDQMDNICPRSNQESLQRLESQHASILRRKKRQSTGKDIIVSQPCLQLMANGNRKPFNKEFDFDEATGIPWQTGLRRGTALEEEQDRILILQEGYYYVYSQVYYRDTQIAMGQVIIRWKASVVGNEATHVVLFRCIKNMRQEYSFNTCFTGGVVKLEIGDHLELLIPRTKANVSLDGEGTFMGAIKLVGRFKEELHPESESKQEL